MTPEEHYRTAEHWSERAGEPVTREEAYRLAQVHATLAAAAQGARDETPPVAIRDGNGVDIRSKFTWARRDDGWVGTARETVLANGRVVTTGDSVRFSLGVAE